MMYLQYHSFNYPSVFNGVDRYHLEPETFECHVSKISKSENIKITFDDGSPSFYHVAFPIMQKYNVPAIIFVDTAEIGKSRMTADQIKKVSSAGFDIQSHSHNHQNHYHLTDEEIIEEGHISKDILEEITGKPVNKYAFPGGAYDLRCCDILNSLGYNEFYTSDYGTNKKIVEEYTVFNRIETYC